MRRHLVATFALLLGATACTEDSPTAPVEPELSRVEKSHHGPAPVYRITIRNLTEGQPFTPPVALMHGRHTRLFRLGSPASEGVQQIAENGNLAPLIEALQADLDPNEVLITPGPETVPGPIMPGQTVEFEVQGSAASPFISMVSMLVCTNDGFTGLNRRLLPRRVGKARRFLGWAFDAGTEINTEAWEDLVPPCGPLTGFDSMGQGTGMTNPELAQNGVVRIHRGIRGRADLDRAVHGWRGPTAIITVERIG